MNEPVSLDALFKEKIFRIPDYQRGFAWQTPQLKDFWEDLVNLSDSRSHYVGVLTLTQISNNSVDESEKEYWLLEDHSYKLFHIVDGQQRLTTFIIFIQSFIELMRELPENQNKTDDEIYVTESLNISEIQNKYLFRIKPTGDQYRTYKFGYLVDNPSYDYLRYMIFNEEGAPAVQETFYTLNLSNAKKFFKKQLDLVFQNEGYDGLKEIYKKLTKQFLFNEYIIKDDFDVFVAFETMNNRGKKLSDLELLKNRLIYLSTLYNDNELDSAERASLRETINNTWKEVYHQLGRNKTRPLNDDDFLRAHWIMYFQYSRITGKDYIKFLLNDKFTPKNVHEKIAREVILEIPEEQRFESGDDDSENSEIENTPETHTRISARLSPIEIRDYVNSLKESAIHWFNTFYPNMDDNMNEEEILWIERLNRVGMGYFRPLLMAILKNIPDEDQRISIFKEIERFLFIVFRMTSTKSNYGNSEFYNYARSIDRKNGTLEELKRKLSVRMSFVVPPDRTIRSIEFYNVLYKKFQGERSEGYYDWAGLRYLLYEYELSLLSNSRQKKVDWNDLLKTPKDKISIEHIYPQKESGHWIEVFKDIPEDQKKYYRASLGNLLLLSQAINSSLQNDNFDKKKLPKYDNRGKKIRNGYSDGSHSEIEVSVYTDWGPDEIHERGMKIFEFMEERWGFKFKSDEDKEEILFLDFNTEE